LDGRPKKIENGTMWLGKPRPRGEDSIREKGPQLKTTGGGRLEKGKREGGLQGKKKCPGTGTGKGEKKQEVQWLGTSRNKYLNKKSEFPKSKMCRLKGKIPGPRLYKGGASR